MDVILLERIEKLGAMGDVVSVKPGYGRNALKTKLSVKPKVKTLLQWNKKKPKRTRLKVLRNAQQQLLACSKAMRLTNLLHHQKQMAKTPLLLKLKPITLNQFLISKVWNPAFERGFLLLFVHMKMKISIGTSTMRIDKPLCFLQ